MENAKITYENLNKEQQEEVKRYSEAITKIEEGMLRDPVYARQVQRARAAITAGVNEVYRAQRAGDMDLLLRTIRHVMIIADTNQPPAAPAAYAPEAEEDKMKHIITGLSGSEKAVAWAASIIKERRKQAIEAGIPAGVWWAAAEIITARGHAYTWIDTRDDDIRALMWAIRADGMPEFENPTSKQALYAERCRLTKIVQIAQIGCREGAKESGGSNTRRRMDQLVYIRSPATWIEDEYFTIASAAAEAAKEAEI